MAMGVCAPPTAANGHNGSIFFERVSRQEKYSKTTCNQNLSDVAGVNAALKRGEWIELVPENDNM